MSDPRFHFDWPSHKALLAIALPMILSNITVPLLGLVDTAVVGHLSEAYYLGGVAVGSMIITFMFWLAGFLRMATTGVTAQAYGRGDRDLQVKRLVHGLFIALFLGLLILLLQNPIERLGFVLAGGSDEVQHYGKQYFAVRVFSAPAALVNLVLLGWMLGMQNAKGPMWHLICTNVINIVLDVFFVFGLDWGVQGVAGASVIADYCGVLIGGYFVLQIAAANGIRFESKQFSLVGQGAQIRSLLQINFDIFIRTICLSVCFAFMTFQGAKLGDNIVAANAILHNLLLLVAFALDGIAYAVEALIGKAVGAKDRQNLNRSVNNATLWSVVFAVLFTLGFWLGGGLLIRVMSDIPDVVTTAEVYLPWIIVLPLVSHWCFLYDGIFIGLTRAADMRNSMFLAMVTFFGVWWLSQDWGNHALWLAMLSFMFVRGGSLFVRLRHLLRRDLVIAG